MKRSMLMTTKFLKFWGTRGSCSVSGQEYSHFGGNSCCLELCYDDTTVIFDAGTGIRPCGLALKNHQKIDLFLSHMHWDHLIGFPFFEPLYRKEIEITIWTPKVDHRAPRELFEQLLRKEFFPIDLDETQAKLQFKLIEAGRPVQLGPITLNFHPTIHPGITLCFQIKTPYQRIGYVTDNEIDISLQKSFIEFHKGSDLFIHEAQYSPEEYEKKHGWGHSSLNNALKLVREINPKRWLVTHHDPKHTDADLRKLEQLAKESSLPCPVEWVFDGYTCDLK